MCTVVVVVVVVVVKNGAVQERGSRDLNICARGSATSGLLIGETIERSAHCAMQLRYDYLSL